MTRLGSATRLTRVDGEELDERLDAAARRRLRLVVGVRGAQQVDGSDGVHEHILEVGVEQRHEGRRPAARPDRVLVVAARRRQVGEHDGDARRHVDRRRRQQRDERRDGAGGGERRADGALRRHVAEDGGRRRLHVGAGARLEQAHEGGHAVWNRAGGGRGLAGVGHVGGGVWRRRTRAGTPSGTEVGGGVVWRGWGMDGHWTWPEARPGSMLQSEGGRGPPYTYHRSLWHCMLY